MSQRAEYKQALHSDLPKLIKMVENDPTVLSYTFGDYYHDSLEVACVLGRSDTVKFLIETGAFDVKQALQFANERSTDKIIAIIQKHIDNQDDINNNAKSARMKK